MFIEIEVEAGENCPYPVTKVFSALGERKPVSRVRAITPDGRELLCAVTGWSSTGASPAYAVRVEDSGEGVAMLVYGGDQGVRLKPAGSPEPWDLHSPQQWGEPCLLLDKDAELA